MVQLEVSFYLSWAGPSSFQGWETPWAELCLPEARRVWEESSPLVFVLTAQFCRVVFGRVSRQPESHMMSQTVTQAGCLIPTQHPGCTMSHPGHPARCIRGLTLGHLPLGPMPTARLFGVWGWTGPRRGPVGEPRGRVGELVMSRAAVGGSPGGEAPSGEFSKSSVALH